jgi:hypothetical protein
MPPNAQLSDKINFITRCLLKDKKINQYSNNVGATYCIAKSNKGWRSTLPHLTKDHGVSNKASDVKAAKDMGLSQSLRACFRSNVKGKRGCAMLAFTWDYLFPLI